jgi:tetratricopeptide (TPR) repeat protein
MTAGYTTREVARLLKMPEHRVREFVRAGIVSGSKAQPPPGRKRVELRFDFRDVLLLRMANRLVANGLPARRVKRALVLLKEQIRGDKPLTGVQLFAEGGKVLASDGRALWEPESGQQHLRFDAPEKSDEEEDGDEAAAGDPRPIGTREGGSALPLEEAEEPRTADTWFDLAMQLEQTEPHRAYKAYLRALEANPEHVEAHINIGRLCSAAGELERASAYFRQAIRLEPHHPVAHFNLAVTLHDLGDLEAARDAYRLSLRHDPSFADAHYNLAALLSQQGDEQGAREHMTAYEAIRGNAVED